MADNIDQMLTMASQDRLGLGGFEGLGKNWRVGNEWEDWQELEELARFANNCNF